MLDYAYMDNERHEAAVAVWSAVEYERENYG
jgi:hypothetical protein